MKNYPLILVTLLIGFYTFSVNAQDGETLTSESRDAASAYMGTMNFVVGRLGLECLSLIGRSETPKEFANAWQQRNAKYFSASIKYMGKRLDAALSSGGIGARDAVLYEYSSAVRRDGEASVADWFRKGNKEDTCKRAVALIDAKAMDVSAKVPMYGELEALASWAEAN
jgi:hypothetical protein